MHVLQRLGERRADLRLLVGGEAGEDAVDRLRRAGRVERAEDDVAGLGGGERERDRLVVAQLADDDDVGILAQRGAQRARERSVCEPTSR